jgi:hypothetical protein
MAQRTPLHQTKVGKRVLSGALLMSYQEDGCSPRVRFITSPTARSGSPWRQSVTSRFVKAYAMAPLVPAATVRCYQNV